MRCIDEARDWFERQEIEQLSEQKDEELIKEAIKDVQERGIVFLDEIDKICCPKGAVRTRGDASDEGVQRDLLPLIEGTMIETKYGEVDTSKILFITSGAFYSVRNILHTFVYILITHYNQGETKRHLTRAPGTTSYSSLLKSIDRGGYVPNLDRTRIQSH